MTEIPRIPETDLLHLEQRAINVRKDVVRMIGVARSGHLVSSLSIVDILTWLYWRVLRVSPEGESSSPRHPLAPSKGHGSPPPYPTPARRGFFPWGGVWGCWPPRGLPSG